MSEYFVKLPHEAADLIISGELTAVGAKLYLLILKSANNKTKVFIATTKRLLEILKCGRWVLSRERLKLVKHGLICFKNYGKTQPGKYWLPYTSKPAEKFKRKENVKNRDELKRFDSAC